MAAALFCLSTIYLTVGTFTLGAAVLLPLIGVPSPHVHLNPKAAHTVGSVIFTSLFWSRFIVFSAGFAMLQVEGDGKSLVLDTIESKVLLASAAMLNYGLLFQVIEGLIAVMRAPVPALAVESVVVMGEVVEKKQ